MAFKMKNTAYYKNKFTESEMSSPYSKSSFTTDYKNELAKLTYQLQNVKNEEEAIIIQNKIKALQNKMNKEGTGGKMKAYPVVPKIASRIKK